MAVGQKTGHEWASTRRATRIPVDPVELAWAAGFLEGEGCFSVSQRSQMIQATQKNRQPLEVLVALFGGSLIEFERSFTVYEKRRYFLWRVSGSRARGIMMTLYLAMSQKRRE